MLLVVVPQWRRFLQLEPTGLTRIVAFCVNAGFGKVFRNMVSSSGESAELLPRGWDQSIPFAGSLLVHLALLGFMAAVVMPSLVAREAESVDLEILDTAVAAAPTMEPLVSPFDGAAPKEDSQDTLQSVTTQISSPEAEFVEAPLTDISAPLESSEVGTLAGALTQKVSGSKKSSGKGQGTGNGNGNGKGGTGQGGGTGARSFFGINVQGKSTVFVVDASRSMNMPHPGPSRTRFNRVKLELLRTISRMTEDEHFFIIFFGDGALPMPADRLMPADESTKRRYLSWTMSVPAEGRTFPQQALMLALNLQPEMIYFLTDGQFDYSVVPGVSAANQNGIPIHTIGFSDNIGEFLLREIAERNNGTYTFIPPDEPGATDAGESAASIISQLSK